MNRPRNRQARLPRNNNSTVNRSNRAAGSGSSVPSSQQVVTGASVSIVQKADQPTGREVQGIVKDVLTRGNHPRGIKVRLQDDRIGRVQRIAPVNGSNLTNSAYLHQPAELETLRSLPDQHGKSDGEQQDGTTNPSSSLESYVVSRKKRSGHSRQTQDKSLSQPAVVAQCPICETFQGDEDAVSYHVQQHLDGEASLPE